MASSASRPPTKPPDSASTVQPGIIFLEPTEVEAEAAATAVGGHAAAAMPIMPVHGASAAAPLCFLRLCAAPPAALSARCLASHTAWYSMNPCSHSVLSRMAPLSRRWASILMRAALTVAGGITPRTNRKPCVSRRSRRATKSLAANRGVESVISMSSLCMVRWRLPTRMRGIDALRPPPVVEAAAAAASAASAASSASSASSGEGMPIMPLPVLRHTPMAAASVPLRLVPMDCIAQSV